MKKLIYLLIFVIFCAAMVCHLACAENVEKWMPASAAVGEGHKILFIERPTTTWTMEPFQHKGMFVQFFRFYPRDNESVWFDVRMMRAPLREEFTDAVQFAKDMKPGLAEEPTTLSEVTLKEIVIDGEKAGQLVYKAKNDEGKETWRVDTIVFVEHTWFLLVYEAPVSQFANYEPVFERILSSIKFSRESLVKFWAEQQIKAEK